MPGVQGAVEVINARPQTIAESSVWTWHEEKHIIHYGCGDKLIMTSKLAFVLAQ